MVRDFIKVISLLIPTFITMGWYYGFSWILLVLCIFCLATTIALVYLIEEFSHIVKTISNKIFDNFGTEQIFIRQDYDTQQLIEEWLKENNIIWYQVRDAYASERALFEDDDDLEEQIVDVYRFLHKKHAILFKLTWG